MEGEERGATKQNRDTKLLGRGAINITVASQESVVSKLGTFCEMEAFRLCVRMPSSRGGARDR